MDLYHPPRISWGHGDRFYVDVDVDGEVQTTGTLGKHELPWKDCLTLYVLVFPMVHSLNGTKVTHESPRPLHYEFLLIAHFMKICISAVSKRSWFLSSVLLTKVRFWTLSTYCKIIDIGYIANIIVRELPHLHLSGHVDDATKTRISFSMKRAGESRELQSNSVSQAGKPESCRSLAPCAEEQSKPTTERSLKAVSPPLTMEEQPKPTTERPIGAISEPDYEVARSKPSKREILGTALMAAATLIPNEEQIQQIVNNANTFSPLLDKLHIFLSLTDTIGDVSTLPLVCHWSLHVRSFTLT